MATENFISIDQIRRRFSPSFHHRPSNLKHHRFRFNTVRMMNQFVLYDENGTLFKQHTTLQSEQQGEEEEMNAPDRYERFVVPEGTKKVSYERDTKIINAASFTIEIEDHTIGNFVRMQLHRDDNVLFSGYKLPHPLQYKIVVRGLTLIIVDMPGGMDEDGPSGGATGGWS